MVVRFRAAVEQRRYEHLVRPRVDMEGCLVGVVEVGVEIFVRDRRLLVVELRAELLWSFAIA